MLGGFAALFFFWDRFHPASVRSRRMKKKAQAMGLRPDLESELLSLAVGQPAAWEYLLFEAALSAELDRSRPLEEDLRLGAVVQVRTLTPAELLEMGCDSMVWMRRQLEQIDLLIDPGFIEAVGKPGTPGDPAKIVELAERFGRLYRENLQRQLDYKAISMPRAFDGLLRLMVDYLGVLPAMIRRVRDQAFITLQRQLNSPKELRPLLGEGVVIFKPEYDTDALVRELDRLIAEGRFHR